MKLHLPKGLFVAVMAACGLAQTAYGDAWVRDNNTDSYYIITEISTPLVDAYDIKNPTSNYQIKAGSAGQKTIDRLILVSGKPSVFMWNWRPEPDGTNLNLLVKELQFGQDGTGAGSISVNANQVVTINKVAATSSITSLNNTGTLTLGTATVGTVTNTGTLNILGTMTGQGDNATISGSVNAIVDNITITNYEGVTYSYAEGSATGKSGFITGTTALTIFKDIDYTGAEATVNGEQATLDNGRYSVDRSSDTGFYVGDAWTFNATQSAGATAYYVGSSGTMTVEEQDGDRFLTKNITVGGTMIIKDGDAINYNGSLAITINGGTMQLDARQSVNSGHSFELINGQITGAGGEYNNEVRYMAGLDLYDESTMTITASGSSSISTGIGLRKKAGAVKFAVTDSTDFLTVSGVIAGVGGVKKTGAGTLILSGANTYSGGTTIESGTLTITHKSALGTGTVVVGENATLETKVSGQNNQALAGIAGVTLKTGATLKNSGGHTWADQPQLTVLTLEGDASVDAMASLGLVASSYAATTLNLNGHTLTKKGNGNFALLSTNVIGGGTIDIAAGNVLVGHSNKATTLDATGTTIKLAAGKLALENSSSKAIIEALTGTGGTVENNGTIELQGTGSYSFAAAVSGSGSIKVTGAGTHTYTGSSLANSIELAANSGFDFASDTDVAYEKLLSGSGEVTKSGTGTLTLSGANTYTGGTTINGGNLVIKSAAALGTGPVTLAGGNLIWWGNGGTINTVSVTKDSDFTIHDQDDAETEKINLGSVTIAENVTLTVNKNTTTGNFAGNKPYGESWKHNLNIGVLTGAGALDVNGPGNSTWGEVITSSLTIDSLKGFTGNISVTSREAGSKNAYTATINTGADGASFKSLTAAGFGEAGETSAFTFNVQGATTVENINVTSGKAIIDIAKEGTLNAFTKGGDGSITMKGSGIYNLGSSTALNAELDSTWTGTVKLSGATLADADLNAYGNANSTVQLNSSTGSLKAGDVNTKVELKGAPAFKVTETTGKTVTFNNAISGDADFVVEATANTGTDTYEFKGDVSNWKKATDAKQDVGFIAASDTKVTYEGNATTINHGIYAKAGKLDATIGGENAVTVNGDISNRKWTDSTGELNLTVANSSATGVTFNNAVKADSITVNGNSKATFNNQAEATALTVGEKATATFTQGTVKLTDVTMDKGASLAITAAKTLTFQNLTLADGTTINPKAAATLVDAAEATTNVSITVSKKASFGAGATINADLTLANGATVEMADALTLGGTLTLNTGLTLGGELYTAITSMTEKSEAIVLFSGVTELLGVDALTRSGEINFSTYFTNVTSETGTYELYYNEGKVSVAFTATPVVDPDGGETDIPEPTTGALSLLGLAALAMRRRRRA